MLESGGPFLLDPAAPAASCNDRQQIFAIVTVDDYTVYDMKKAMAKAKAISSTIANTRAAFPSSSSTIRIFFNPPRSSG